MKLLVDENLSPRLAGDLSKIFPGSAHVNDCGLASAADGAIWSFARANGFTIVSKDSDFHGLASIDGGPPKVIWIRAGNSSTNEIASLLLRARAAIEALAASVENVLMIRPSKAKR